MTREFKPLPVATNGEGDARRTGIEVEFSGLDEAAAARVVAEALGGTPRQDRTHDWVVEDSRLGRIEIILDTALRDSGPGALREAGLRLGGEAIPVEVVSPPLTRNGMEQFDRAREALRLAGATGSRGGLLYGFGVHFNVEIASRDAAGITRPLLAYALIEDWLREADPIDVSRRVLPFTDPYPTALTRALTGAGPDASPDRVLSMYLDHTTSRNHGLDMLPLFAWMDEAAVAAKVREGKALKARPAFHFRLPDSRIDEEGWSLADEWDRWWIVEKVASDDALLHELCEGWETAHGLVTLSRAPWAERAGDILERAGFGLTRKAA
ncbi:MAG: amidoligase family protein [Pseudooceanicola sp.]